MPNNDQHTAQTGLSGLFANLYRLFAYFGLFALFGCLFYGFRYDTNAPNINYLYNLLLYSAFILPHLVMTRSWFKKAIYGNPAGHPNERRVYITITVITWLAVLWFHWPVSGLSFIDQVPESVRFAGTIFVIFGVLLFFDGVKFKMIDGLLGVPGGASAYSHGSETPLFTEGQYGSVRHPMYRAFFCAAVASLLIYPHAGQLLWTGMMVATFVLFIPVEEAQMIKARGDDYRAYQTQTRWRLIRGVW